MRSFSSMKTELRDSDPDLRKKMGRKNPREIEMAGFGSEPAAVGRSEEGEEGASRHQLGGEELLLWVKLAFFAIATWSLASILVPDLGQAGVKMGESPQSSLRGCGVERSGRAEAGMKNPLFSLIGMCVGGPACEQEWARCPSLQLGPP